LELAGGVLQLVAKQHRSRVWFLPVKRLGWFLVMVKGTSVHGAAEVVVAVVVVIAEPTSLPAG